MVSPWPNRVLRILAVLLIGLALVAPARAVMVTTTPAGTDPVTTVQAGPLTLDVSLQAEADDSGSLPLSVGWAFSSNVGSDQSQVLELRFSLGVVHGRLRCCLGS